MMTNCKESESNEKKFKRNAALSWEGILKDNFCDMTLSGDELDLGAFPVHKTVVASSSSLLKKILKFNKNPNPLILLSGVSYGNLECLVKFMYQGEVNVDHTNLESFLETAEFLGLKGLTENKNVGKVCESSSKKQKIEDKGVKVSVQEEKLNLERKEDIDDEHCGSSSKKPEVEEEGVTNFEQESKNCNDIKIDFDKSIIDSKIEPEEVKETQRGSKDQTVFINNIESKPYMCDECNRKFMYTRTLNMHKLTYHSGQRFFCDQCEFQDCSQTNLKVHIESVHIGVKYPCRVCDYEASRPGNLKVHVQKHMGVRFSCDKCEFQATEKTGIKKHKERIHDGIRYPCNQCQFIGTEKRHLYRHLEKYHS